MTLDTWATTQPGRCIDCGVHLEKQAALHVGGCLTTAQREQAAGMARATAAHPDERAKVDAAIRSLAATREEFSANRVRELTGGIRGGVVGAAFREASRAGLIRKVGSEPSTDPGTHAHPITTWRGAA